FSRDETPWKGVNRLVEAHVIEVGRAGPQAREYWQPDLFSPLSYRSDDEYADHYRHLFTDSVRRTARSHRKLAVEVSGGLDSSAILAVAENLRRRQELPAPGIAAYTLKFDEDPEANELEYARAVSVHVGIPVHEVSPMYNPLSWYRTWAKTYKEFPGYPNGVMAMGLREVARDEGCRVVLSGVGGDEWLWGNRAYYAEELASGRWRSLYECVRTDCREAGAMNALWWLGRHAAMLLPRCAEETLRRMRAVFSVRVNDRKAWLTPKLRKIASQRKADLALSFESRRFGRAGQRIQYETLYSAYSVIARELDERAAASVGMEVRLPFWNTAMVQFAFSTPERLRLRGGTPKILHRRAMAGLLPGNVLERKDKSDFMVTFRRHADAINSDRSLDMRREQHEWVLESRTMEMYNQFGNRQYEGEPEWMLWSLFGWSALASGLEI
ncbi:MAG TPA: asparagine synthase C-terminal domain-containing protein, partial [Burkholderiales bacterium]|nr:asparagine synthase C-terminal domain-containing protein [Burkholderiales bacterium]